MVDATGSFAPGRALAALGAAAGRSAMQRIGGRPDGVKLPRPWRPRQRPVRARQRPRHARARSRPSENVASTIYPRGVNAGAIVALAAAAVAVAAVVAAAL